MSAADSWAADLIARATAEAEAAVDDLATGKDVQPFSPAARKGPLGPLTGVRTVKEPPPPQSPAPVQGLACVVAASAPAWQPELEPETSPSTSLARFTHGTVLKLMSDALVHVVTGGRARSLSYDARVRSAAELLVSRCLHESLGVLGVEAKDAALQALADGIQAARRGFNETTDSTSETRTYIAVLEEAASMVGSYGAKILDEVAERVTKIEKQDRSRNVKVTTAQTNHDMLGTPEHYMRHILQVPPDTSPLGELLLAWLRKPLPAGWHFELTASNEGVFVHTVGVRQYAHPDEELMTTVAAFYPKYCGAQSLNKPGLLSNEVQRATESFRRRRAAWSGPHIHRKKEFWLNVEAAEIAAYDPRDELDRRLPVLVAALHDLCKRVQKAADKAPKLPQLNSAQSAPDLHIELSQPSSQKDPPVRIPSGAVRAVSLQRIAQQKGYAYAAHSLAATEKQKRRRPEKKTRRDESAGSPEAAKV